jgi:hypothetical protein
MFIFWGTRRTEKKLGFVADFCPLCRSIAPFQLKRVGLASHVYGLSIGPGKLTGHIIECNVCHLRMMADPMRYNSPAGDSSSVGDIGTLISQTFPKLREEKAERLAIEQQLRTDPSGVPADLRGRLLLEPLQLVSPEVEEIYERDTRLDKRSGVGCLGTMLITVILLVLCVHVSYNAKLQGLTGEIALFCFVVGTTYTFVQLALGPGRIIRTRIIPRLGRSLGPLRPTRQEVSAALQRCKEAGMKIGTKVKIDRLLTEVERNTTKI